eukprot:COSAG04_NODE_8590_length_953_cov_1.546838_2_plen_66_part_01
MAARRGDTPSLMWTHAVTLLVLLAALPAAVHASEATSAAGRSSAAAVVCVSPQRGFCGTCDACCAV